MRMYQFSIVSNPYGIRFLKFKNITKSFENKIFHFSRVILTILSTKNCFLLTQKFSN